MPTSSACSQLQWMWPLNAKVWLSGATKQSISGNAGGSQEGLYSPVTRLVAPDFEFYVKEARQSPPCPVSK